MEFPFHQSCSLLSEAAGEAGSQRFSSPEDGLERELKQLLYSPPQSEADSDGGLYDITTLLSSELRTPDSGGGGMASLRPLPPLAVDDQFGGDGSVRDRRITGSLQGAAKPPAPPYPDWQLTPPPEGQAHYIKEEQTW